MTKKSTWYNKKYRFEATAYLHESQLPSDVLEDISGNEIGDTDFNKNVKLYKVSQLQTRGKGINYDTRLKMDNLRKQLKGFKYLLIQF